MHVWHRVFGGNDIEPPPEALLSFLQASNEVDGASFQGDDQGWYRLLIRRKDGRDHLEVDRFLSEEQGVRAELNTWAAWIESLPDSPASAPLMARIVSARQVLAFKAESEDEEIELPVLLCQNLAQTTEGVYQIDGLGFHTADGALLIAEDAI